jgi:predicted Fe-Mo cluster-binding NifX family protein
MKIAVSISDDGNISPLFDVSKRVWIGEQLPDRGYEPGDLLEIASSDGESKINILVAKKVEFLLCGAISRCLEAYARSYGMEIEPFLCGSMDEILEEFAKGESIKPAHRMPGCPGRREMNNGCLRKAGCCPARDQQNIRKSK